MTTTTVTSFCTYTCSAQPAIINQSSHLPSLQIVVETFIASSFDQAAIGTDRLQELQWESIHSGRPDREKESRYSQVGKG